MFPFELVKHEDKHKMERIRNRRGVCRTIADRMCAIVPTESFGRVPGQSGGLKSPCG